MNIIYYFAGLLSGVSIASFFIGKELYKFYVKDKVQKKQLERMEKLNKQFKKTFDMEGPEFSS
jgi:uncharacterized membrane protein YdjX (TVP38/TMEM64 family)